MADLTVVGAGFAGLACARAAAARGLDVLVLERKPDPGATPRTTGLLVQEAVDAADLPASLLRKIPRVRLYAPSLRHTDLSFPGYRFHATDTAGLLRWLAAEAARAGTTIRCGEAFRDAAQLDARYVVGADGPRSRVARAYGLGRNRRFLFGVEAHVRGVRGADPDCLHCFLDARLAPGYLGWLVPGPDSMQIGLAARLPARPDLPAFLRRLSRVFDLSRARIVERRGGLIPVGGPVRPAARPGVLLVGDAAGLVSPLTAGGIRPALDLGRLAGVAVVSHLRDGGPDPGAAVARHAPRFRGKRVLRRLYDLGPPNLVLDAVLGSRLFRKLAAAVFFGRP